jgi:hypothetical protein
MSNLFPGVEFPRAFFGGATRSNVGGECGIGLKVERTAGGYEIIGLKHEHPAHLQGVLKVGYLIVSVDDVDVSNCSPCELSPLVLGQEGATVRIGFIRAPGEEVRHVDVVRGGGGGGEPSVSSLSQNQLPPRPHPVSSVRDEGRESDAGLLDDVPAMQMDAFHLPVPPHMPAARSAVQDPRERLAGAASALVRAEALAAELAAEMARMLARASAPARGDCESTDDLANAAANSLEDLMGGNDAAVERSALVVAPPGKEGGEETLGDDVLDGTLASPRSYERPVGAGQPETPDARDRAPERTEVAETHALQEQVHALHQQVHALKLQFAAAAETRDLLHTLERQLPAAAESRALPLHAAAETHSLQEQVRAPAKADLEKALGRVEAEIMTFWLIRGGWEAGGDAALAEEFFDRGDEVLDAQKLGERLHKVLGQKLEPAVTAQLLERFLSASAYGALDGEAPAVLSAEALLTWVHTAYPQFELEQMLLSGERLTTDRRNHDLVCVDTGPSAKTSSLPSSLPRSLPISALATHNGPYPAVVLTIFGKSLEEAGMDYGLKILEEQQREVLAERKRVLGAEHPDTLVAADNLARTLADQGKRAGPGIYLIV